MTVGEHYAAQHQARMDRVGTSAGRAAVNLTPEETMRDESKIDPTACVMYVIRVADDELAGQYVTTDPGAGWEPEWGFNYDEKIERAHRFRSPVAAAEAVKRRAAWLQSYTHHFAILPVRVTEQAEQTAERPREVILQYGPGCGASFRLNNGEMELKAAGSSVWSPAWGWALSTPVGAHNPEELRMFATLRESPTETVVVAPAKTVVELV